MDQRELIREERTAVLPLDPTLEVALTAPVPVETRTCPVCRQPALLGGRAALLFPACAQAAHRKQQRDLMRKKRG